jgi:hypothetical protein
MFLIPYIDYCPVELLNIILDIFEIIKIKQTLLYTDNNDIRRSGCTDLSEFI